MLYVIFVLFIVGTVIGALCTVIGPTVFRDIRDTVLFGLKKYLEVPKDSCDKCGTSSELTQVGITIVFEICE